MASHTSSPQARSKAVSKYITKTYDRIEVRYPKTSGMKQTITEHAAKMGEDTVQFIRRAIKEAIENDNCKSDT